MTAPWFAVWTAVAIGQTAQIEVRVDQATRPASRLLTGACIEDVNHEIYGGIYSQMVFGESFQEPPRSAPKGFTAYGGVWNCERGELHFRGVRGDKLVENDRKLDDGSVSVEAFIPDRRSVNVGLIVRVANAGNGMDSFDGYEISLNAERQHVLFGRHRHDWRNLREFPCAIPTGKWVALQVNMKGSVIAIEVDRKPVGQFDDGAAALQSGKIGLRAFQEEARYRNLRVTMVGCPPTPVPFESAVDDAAGVSGMWRPVRGGTAQGSFSLDRATPFVGALSQRLTFAGGAGRIGVENRGLNRWGMAFVQGKPYEGNLRVRADAAMDLFVSLESADGKRILAEEKLVVEPGDWRRAPFALTPNASDPSGRFVVSLKSQGSATLGYAFLQPGAWGRFHDLPIRRDVAVGLLDQGVTILRYGGSMINHPQYRWKKTIGPRDLRPPNAGAWYPYSSNGWGIPDFLNLCEKLGVQAMPAFNMDESPTDMMDFIEYVNGPADSEWGRRRAADGHPAPYRLKYLQLGNEERVDESYLRKFQALAEALWSRDPEIVLVIGDFAYNEPIKDPFDFRGADSGVTTLAAHREILRLAKKHNRDVWFDVHVWTDGPRPRMGGLFSYVDALEKLADGAKHRVVVFEFNANNHEQRRALANAAGINAILRDGRIPVVCSANCLQPDGQNDNGWNQGLLFLSPTQVWLQPPGYVTQMYSRSWLPKYAPCTITGAGDALDVAALCSDDGKRVTVRVVNFADRRMTAVLKLTGFAPHAREAKVTELAAPLEARNTAADPNRVTPKRKTWSHGFKDGAANYTFPPHSVTILEWQ